jgi:GxxExxY protein
VYSVYSVVENELAFGLRIGGEKVGSLVLEDESYRIRGAIFAVYKEIGCGFLEAIYQECLEKEFRHQGIPADPHKELPLYYKGELLMQTYRPDFICYDLVILEIKAVKELADEHRAQVHNYLKASGLQLGILVNFGHHSGAAIERIVR